MIRIRIQGNIGFEVTPKDISDKLDELNMEDIVIDINTRGGIVYEGVEIYNRIVQYQGKKTAALGAIVASIGTFISAAFDHVQAHDFSAFMIHNVTSGVYGDAADLREEADKLDRVNTLVATKLAQRSGKTVEEIIALMDAETWFYGKEIVDAGFADELIKTGRKPDKKVAFAAVAQMKEMFNQRVAMAAKQVNTNVKNNDIKKINKKEIQKMDKAELLTRLNVLKTNGEITLLEIAEALGLEEQLVTPEMKKASGIINRLNTAGVTDVEQEIERLQKAEQAGDQAVRDNRLLENYGPKKFQDGRENEVRRYADQRLTGKVTIEEIDKDPIMASLKAQSADYSSPANRLKVKEVKDRQASGSDDGVEVLTY